MQGLNPKHWYLITIGFSSIINHNDVVKKKKEIVYELPQSVISAEKEPKKFYIAAEQKKRLCILL